MHNETVSRNGVTKLQNGNPPPSFNSQIYDLISQLSNLAKAIETSGEASPSLKVGSTSSLWTTSEGPLAATRDRVLELFKTLGPILQGPHEYFHDLVSPNWDLGALYTLIEFDIIDKIALDGSADYIMLSKVSGIHERKMLNILRLASCSGILCESSPGVFSHTALSEELRLDPKFRAFIGFQLYETRIGSTNLADSLKDRSNTFEDGESAFKFATGAPLYNWHAEHEEKGQRFRMAMESVSRSLDPADRMFQTWFEQHQATGSGHRVVDVFGGNRLFFQDAAENLFPQFIFQSASSIKEASSFDGPILAYTVRNVFWNKTDNQLLALLAEFADLLKKTETILLVNEMLSPDCGEFEGTLNQAYRRRDVTTMTMHNAKQRTRAEFQSLFEKADPDWEISVSTAHSSHSYRGLWQLRRQPGGQYA